MLSDSTASAYRARFFEDKAQYKASKDMFFVPANPVVCDLTPEDKERLHFSGKSLAEVQAEIAEKEESKERANPMSSIEYENIDAVILDGACPVEGKLSGRVKSYSTATSKFPLSAGLGSAPKVIVIEAKQITEGHFVDGVLQGEYASYSWSKTKTFVKTDMGLIEEKPKNRDEEAKQVPSLLFIYGTTDGITVNFSFYEGKSDCHTAVKVPLGEDRLSITVYTGKRKTAVTHMKNGNRHGEFIIYGDTGPDEDPVPQTRLCFKDDKEVNPPNCTMD